MPTYRRLFGDLGEDAAVDFFIQAGYRILERQYCNRFGEVDLIVRDGPALVFVEVKARTNTVAGYPEESVTKPKLKRIENVALQYLHQIKQEDADWRIDVLAISYTSGIPEILHLKHVSL